MKAALLAASLLCALAPGAVCKEDPFTADFYLEDCSFFPRGHNTFFSIDPGDQWYYEGEEDGAAVSLLITVLHEKEWISFETPEGVPVTAWARVVEEREWEDGELVEVSRNFFSRCGSTGAIYYFGEEVDDYEDGEIAGHGGAWRAGEDGAVPGLIMPGTFLIGARYFQEIAPGVALDRAEHAAMGLEVEVPAGTFERCVEVAEDSALEKGAESTKVYCPGVGMVQDDDLELVWFSRVQ